MSNPLSDFDPAPVVPLEYEPSGISASGAIVSWVCIISAICLGVGLLLETGQALINYTLANGRVSMTFGPGGGLMLYLVLPVIVHGAMLIGCISSIRFNPAGWHWVIWGSAATLVLGLILLVITCATYTSRPIGPGNSYYLYFSLLTNCLNVVRASFVPVVLICLFCLADVRALFRR